MIHKRGTTLLETLLSTGIFTVLVLATFIFFDMGRTKWSWMNLQRKIGADARSAVADVARNARRTVFESIDIYTNLNATPTVSGITWPNPVRRDDVSFVGAGDPLDPNTYNPATGEPVWNKYVVYVADTSTTQGGELGQGAAGSGLFVKIVSTFNATAANPLPLHNAAFRSTVNWVTKNAVGTLTWPAQVGELSSHVSARFAGVHFGDWVAQYNPNNPQYIAPAGTPAFPMMMMPPAPMPNGPEPEAAVPPLNGPDPAAGVAAAQTAVTALINTSLAGAGGSATLALAPKGVQITLLGSVFAVMYSVSTDRELGITYQARGSTSEGMAKQQIDASIAVLGKHGK